MIALRFEEKKAIGWNEVRALLEPVCPYGRKRLKEEGFYAPEAADALETELNNVSLLKEALENAPEKVHAVREALRGLKDLSLTFRRCEEETLSEVELFELTAFCLRIEALRPLVRALPGCGALDGIRFLPVDSVLRVLDPSDGRHLSFYVEDSRTAALESARGEKRRLERLLREAAEKKDTLPVPQEAAADQERLLSLRQEAVRAEEAALEEIYRQMSLELRPFLPILTSNAAAAGRLDAALTKAILAKQHHGVRPRLGGDSLQLIAAFHPRIAAALATRGRSFTPLTLELPKGPTVLTGANMGGKSVTLQTVLLNVLLALSGCFVFAEEAMIPLFSRVVFLGGDCADAERGLSSFGGEVLRLKETLETLKDGELSLIVMDELARGTNAREGTAIARGTLRYLAKQNAVTLLATHFDGVAEEALQHYQVKGLQNLRAGQTDPAGTAAADVSAPAGSPAAADASAAAAGGLRRIENAMDYGLIRVGSEAECPRDAFTICRLLGLPEELLQ